MPVPADTPRVVIFARWPEPGKVKSRLAKAMGDDRAACIYRRLLEHTIDVARASDLPVELRVTGARPEQFKRAFGPGISVCDQGKGDLGARLARVDAPAIVIGSDLPALTPELLREAALLLGSHEVVIGPARDGGYWLIGLRKACPWLFDEMAWSTPGVLPETLSRLRAREIEPELLPELADVDRAEDLIEWPDFAA